MRKNTMLGIPCTDREKREVRVAYNNYVARYGVRDKKTGRLRTFGGFMLMCLMRGAGRYINDGDKT